MRLHFILPVVLWLAMLRPAPLLAQSAPNRTELADNAAVQYWQAFAQMPTLDKDQEKIIAEWNTVSLDDAGVQKLLAASRSSMLYLQRAAKLPRCDWGLDYDDGVSLMLPHLGKGRELARLAILHGRYEFERGNRKAARDIATATMTLARQIGRDPIMISVLVRLLIEGMVVDLVAPYVPELKAAHAEAVATFGALPKAPGVLQTVPIERKYFLEWMVRKLKEEEQRKKGAGFELWKNFLSGTELPESLKQIATVDEAINLTEELYPIYDELAKILALPKDQFDAQYPAFKQKTKAAYPLAGMLIPAMDELTAKECRGQARLAMLLAAIAFVEGGESKLKEIKDPFGTGPFEYRALDKGFELKSKLFYEGQPVTLAIGQRK